MILVLFVSFSLLFGLGVWETVATHRAQRLHGFSYAYELPRVFHMPTFKVLKLIGACGVFVLPIAAWSEGAFWAIGLTVAFLIAGSAIGFAIPTAIDAMFRRTA